MPEQNNITVEKNVQTFERYIPLKTTVKIGSSIGIIIPKEIHDAILENGESVIGCRIVTMK